MCDNIARLSIFRYREFWRLNGRSTSSQTTCGGITTILLFVVVGILGVVKLREVFLKQHLISKSSSYCEIKSTNVSTSNSTDPQGFFNLPFMIAVRAYDGDMGKDFIYNNFNESKFWIQFRQVQVYPKNHTTIIPENCTLDHFPYQQINDFQIDFNVTIPKKANQSQAAAKQYNASIQQVYQKLRKWKCLPLNKTYELGRKTNNSLLYQLEVIVRVCDNGSTNCTSTSQTNVSKVHWKILNYDTFPSNNTEAARPYIYSKISILQSNTFNSLQVQIDEVKFVTDVSMMPYQSLQKRRAFKLSNNYNEFRIPFLRNFTGTSLRVKYSKLNEIHERKLYALNEAFAYIGGLFQSLFGILTIVILGFKQFSYQAQLAAHYKKDSAIIQGTFKSYLLYLYASLRKLFCCDKQAQKQYQYKYQITQLLDIVNVLRRIKFLQRAMQTIFIRNKLKGYELAKSISQVKLDEKYMNQKYRRSIGRFLEEMSGNRDDYSRRGEDTGQREENNGQREQSRRREDVNLVPNVSLLLPSALIERQINHRSPNESLEFSILPQRGTQYNENKVVTVSAERMIQRSQIIQSPLNLENRQQRQPPIEGSQLPEEDEQFERLIENWLECNGIQSYRNLVKQANKRRNDDFKKTARRIVEQIDDEIRNNRAKPYYSYMIL